MTLVYEHSSGYAILRAKQYKTQLDRASERPSGYIMLQATPYNTSMESSFRTAIWMCHCANAKMQNQYKTKFKKPKSFKIKIQRWPFQNNTHDCGHFCLKYASLIAERKKIQFGPNCVTLYKKELWKKIKSEIVPIPT